MPLDPNGPLTQYRQQIDLHETQIADRPTTSQVLGVFVAAAYGGIGANGPDAQADIGATWQTITGWDQALLTTPKGVSQNFASNGLQVDAQGVFSVYVKITLSFAEVNQSREIKFRIYNQSKGQATAVTFDFFVGRNVGGVNASFQVLAEVAVENINDLFVIQAQSASDTFTTVSNVGSIFQIVHVSELQT
jgi:hypothetical protein